MVSERPTGVVRPETVVFFHAHPDDESIFTGGTIALLAARGVRTVVVIATAGGSEAEGAVTRAAEAPMPRPPRTALRSACRR